MVKIAKEEKVPIYEVKCEECGSALRFTKADVYWGTINCPVCKYSTSVFGYRLCTEKELEEEKKKK